MAQAAADVRVEVMLSPNAAAALCRRTAEVLEMLPAELSCGLPGEPPTGAPALLHVQVRNDGANELTLVLSPGTEPPTLRRLPLPEGVLDEAALEAAASIIASVARAQLLNRAQASKATSQEVTATGPAPSLPTPVQAPRAEEAPPPQATPPSAPLETPREPISEAPLSVAEAPAATLVAHASTDLSVGYGLSLFSPALAFHGASAQLLHRRPLAGSAFVVSVELSLPFARTVDRAALSARMASYLLRATAGVQWPLTPRLSLIALGGLLAQRVDARATRADDTIDSYSNTTYQGIGLALSAALQVRLTAPFFVNLSVGADLDPAMLELGVTRAGQFERLFRSNRVRANAALHVGITL